MFPLGERDQLIGAVNKMSNRGLFRKETKDRSSGVIFPLPQNSDRETKMRLSMGNSFEINPFALK